MKLNSGGYNPTSVEMKIRPQNSTYYYNICMACDLTFSVVYVHVKFTYIANYNASYSDYNDVYVALYMYR